MRLEQTRALDFSICRGVRIRDLPSSPSLASRERRAVFATMALLASLTATLSLVVPDATLNMVKISSIRGGGGQLPLSMCRWPVWMASVDHVTQLSGAGGADEEAGWVDPISFEQLWLPEDLPLPSSHLAVSLVIKVHRATRKERVVGLSHPP
jgi:hypothetical protein